MRDGNRLSRAMTVLLAAVLAWGIGPVSGICGMASAYADEPDDMLLAATDEDDDEDDGRRGEFVTDGNGRVYTDGTTQVDYQQGDGENYRIVSAMVGTWAEDEDNWATMLSEGTDFWVVGMGVVVDGTKLGDYVGQQLRVEVRLASPDDVDERWCDCWLDVCDVEERYDLDHFNDEGMLEMLPGWDQFFDRQQHYYVENTEHPDGWDTEYEITGMEITEGGDHVFLEEKDGGWSLQATSLGEATLHVSYLDIDGTTQERDYGVQVLSKIYNVDLSIDEGHRYLPNTSATLRVSGSWEAAIEGEDGGFEYLSGMGGFTYAWHLEGDVGDYARISSGKGGTSATVYFRDLSADEDEEDYQHGMQVVVTGTCDGVETSSSEWLEVSGDFFELWPAHLASPRMTQPTTFTPEVRHYQYGQRYQAIQDVDYCFEYDEKRLQVSGPDAQGAYTLTRKSPDGTELNLSASWVEDDEGFEEQTDWWLEGFDYDLWNPNDDDIDAFVDATHDDDGTTSGYTGGEAIKLMPAYSMDLAAETGVEWRWTVGTGEWGDDGFEWERTYAEGIDADGMNVTIDPAALATVALADEVCDFRVEVAAVVNGIVLDDTEWWLHIKENEYDYRLGDFWNTLVGGMWAYSAEEDNVAWVCDAAHPEGEDVPFTITNVEVVEGAEYVRLDDPEKHGGEWVLVAESLGEALVRISYNDIYGNPATHEMPVRVTNDIFELTVEAEGNLNTALPGKSIRLVAEGLHAWNDSEGQYHESTEGLSYQWVLPEEAADLATLTPDASDPTHATLTFAASDDADMWEECRPTCVLFYDGEQVYDEDVWTCCAGTYAQLSPRAIEDVPVGQSFSFKPQVERFSVDPKRAAVLTAANIEVSFANGHFDVQKQSDGTYVCTRMTRYPDALSIQASWWEPDDWDDLSGDGHDQHDDASIHLGYYMNEGPLDVADALIDMPQVTYTGEAQAPVPTIYFADDPGTTLADFKAAENPYKLGWLVIPKYELVSITYENNTNAGTATMHLEGSSRLVHGTRDYQFQIKPATPKIKAAGAPKGTLEVLKGKTAKLGATASPKATLSYKSSNTKIATVNKKGQVKGIKPGKATITISAKKSANTKAATKKITVVVKNANTLSAKAKKKTVSAKLASVSKKALTLTNNIKVSKSKGKVSYKNVSTNKTVKKWKLNKKTGKLTIPKGTKKGTYIIKVKVTAAGTSTYAAGSKTVTYKVKVA